MNLFECVGSKMLKSVGWSIYKLSLTDYKAGRSYQAAGKDELAIHRYKQSAGEARIVFKNLEKYQKPEFQKLTEKAHRLACRSNIRAGKLHYKSGDKEEAAKAFGLAGHSAFELDKIELACKLGNISGSLTTEVMKNKPPPTEEDLRILELMRQIGREIREDERRRN